MKRFVARVSMLNNLCWPLLMFFWVQRMLRLGAEFALEGFAWASWRPAFSRRVHHACPRPPPYESRRAKSSNSGLVFVPNLAYMC